MKSAPDMKTNAKFSRDTVQRAQPRTVTDAISISVYLHLAASSSGALPGGKRLLQYRSQTHGVAVVRRNQWGRERGQLFSFLY